MTIIPTISELYFHNGSFFEKSRWTKPAKIIIGAVLVIGGLFSSSLLNRYVPELKLFLEPTSVQKTIDYIQSKNKHVSNADAYQIVKSTTEWSTKYGLDPQLILAVQEVESSFNKFAISHMGALGIMQVIPSWHLDKLKVAISKVGTPELFDIHANIFLGVNVLNECINRLTNLNNSLLCYNGSLKKPNGYDKKVLQARNNIIEFINS